jgi:hypothetical protein
MPCFPDHSLVGISFGVSIPFILGAFYVEQLKDGWNKLWHLWIKSLFSYAFESLGRILHYPMSYNFRRATMLYSFDYKYYIEHRLAEGNYKDEELDDTDAFVRSR